MTNSTEIRRSLEKMHHWELYPQQLMIELRQCTEEGMDIEKYRDLFAAVAALPLDENKVKLADVIFDIVRNAPQREDYAYCEPSDLDSILAERNIALCEEKKPAPADLRERIAGAWYGRIIGCLLGNDGSLLLGRDERFGCGKLGERLQTKDAQKFFGRDVEHRATGSIQTTARLDECLIDE